MYNAITLPQHQTVPWQNMSYQDVLLLLLDSSILVFDMVSWGSIEAPKYFIKSYSFLCSYVAVPESREEGTVIEELMHL